MDVSNGNFLKNPGVNLAGEAVEYLCEKGHLTSGMVFEDSTVATNVLYGLDTRSCTNGYRRNLRGLSGGDHHCST